jgi:hypothetical protein
MSRPRNVSQWLSSARRHLRDGTFDAAVLDELEPLAQSTPTVRQRLLYLHASNPHVYSMVVAYDMIDPADDRPGDIDVDPVFPYESVYKAMCDGWQVIHFPDQRASFDDREIDVLGYEFILQKVETTHA